MKLLVLMLCLFPFAAFSAGEAFADLSKAVSKKTMEKMSEKSPPAKLVRGNQTGGSCKVAADCAIGCKSGESDVTCISKQEGSTSCAAGKKPAGECTCLTSVYACGFAF